jgi:hypothetical protein
LPGDIAEISSLLAATITLPDGTTVAKGAMTNAGDGSVTAE